MVVHNKLDRGEVFVNNVIYTTRNNITNTIENINLKYIIIWRDSAFCDNDKIILYNERYDIYLTFNAKCLLERKQTNIDIDGINLSKIAKAYTFLKKAEVLKLGSFDDKQLAKQISLQFNVINKLGIQIQFLNSL